MSMLTYIIQMESPEAFVKFGRTKNIRSRIKTLSNGVPWPIREVALIDGDMESELKETFAADHVRGEWFKATPALQTWLDKAADDGRLVRQIEVDQAYINSVIKPRIREYLGPREPLNNTGGDLVCRIFADALPTLTGRENELCIATKGHVTQAMARGFCPHHERVTLIGFERSIEPAQAA